MENSGRDRQRKTEKIMANEDGHTMMTDILNT